MKNWYDFFRIVIWNTDGFFENNFKNLEQFLHNLKKNSIYL